MVAKTPLKEKRLAMALDPNLVREAVKKVDKCMARLQELQHTVTGGTKMVSGFSLSPRSTRGYLRTSLRCKQESLRLKNASARKSPVGKFQGSLNGEWQRMSLPARLLGETVGEILQASQFAKEMTAKASTKMPNSKNLVGDPKTPLALKRNTKKKPHCENTELRARRIKEKQSSSHRSSESNSPHLTRARSRIAFKSNSPLGRSDNQFINRVSPKNRPWAKKAVLFPNPLFLSSSSSPKRFCKTRSPIITRTTQQRKVPHKFLIKTPPKSLKSQMKSKKAVPGSIVFSPVEKKLASAKMRRCSFSPSKLASRLVSPLRSRTNGLMSGLKQRPNNFSAPLKISSSIKRI